MSEQPEIDVHDNDIGSFVQAVAEAHLDGCFEALCDELEEDGPADSPAVAPFCGCVTCVVREVLYASWGLITSHTLLQVQASSDAPPDQAG